MQSLQCIYDWKRSIRIWIFLFRYSTSTLAENYSGAAHYGNNSGSGSSNFDQVIKGIGIRSVLLILVSSLCLVLASIGVCICLRKSKVDTKYQINNPMQTFFCHTDGGLWGQTMNPKCFVTRKLPDFQRPTITWNTIILKQTFKEFRSPVYKVSFDIFKGKIGHLFTPKSMFECPLELSCPKIDFVMIFIDQFWSG